MWEAEVVCKACERTHVVSAEVIPRSFSFECPVTRGRVERPFRDPSRQPHPWAEVASASPGATPALFVAGQGHLEV